MYHDLTDLPEHLFVTTIHGAAADEAPLFLLEAGEASLPAAIRRTIRHKEDHRLPVALGRRRRFGEFAGGTIRDEFERRTQVGTASDT